MSFNENSRVKIPAILHLCRLGYEYARHFKFLKDQRIILTDEAIAQKYNGLAHTYYELIRQNIFENQHLSALRDWLLPMLMNGQVKVS